MNAHADFDLELIRRYDQSGPRYTSYPTAPQFQPGLPASSYLAEIEASNGDPVPAPLSLYLHLPFCTNPCFYCGCNRVITRDASRGSAYLRLLEQEIALQGEHFDVDRRVEQLHLGGGSPNFYSTATLEGLLQTIARHFRLAPEDEREFGIEIDPRLVNVAELEQLRRIGFNRISLGVQDFDPVVQKAVNRQQGVEATLELIEAGRQFGFRSINTDLIYGLPKQTLAGFERTLDHVIRARPDRIAAYSYAHLPDRFKAQQRIIEADLPSPAVKLQLLALIVNRLTEAGYRYIGMDHFALPDDELSLALEHGGLQRNFQGYSTHGQCDLIGMGMSSIGNVGDAYVQNQRLLPLWEQRIGSGELAVDRGLVLNNDDRIRRALIQAIMCQGEVYFQRFGRRHGIEFERYFADDLLRLRPLAEDGLLTIEATGLTVSSRGRFLLRPIAMCFDGYLHRCRSEQTSTTPHYSRVI
ncbi:MAG: oxygen-independent coproporphyrinogen III oxidase [Xanthomonadales bacterium]|nr:oxygen-independent coproporphyrinogen III oxidase [Xanthomonadales bacterium]